MIMCGITVMCGTEIALKDFDKALKRTVHRGPDHQVSVQNYGITWGFNRLAIMDLSSKGNQPFCYKDYQVVCNGEIYNYPELKALLKDDYEFKSSSDCEVLIPLYEKYGIEILCKMAYAHHAKEIW